MTSGGCVGRRRIIGVVLAMAGAVALVAGCGTPQFNYISNADEKTYFKVPSGWHEIDESAIDDAFTAGDNPDSATAAIRKQLRWSAAFDAATDPMPEHMTSLVTTDEPVLYVTVRHLTRGEQGVVSFDAMRDFFLPVTEGERSRIAQLGTPQLESFELLQDEVLTPNGGLRGVRVVFNYEFPTGVLHTFDQTAYANHDSSVLYFLLIRCTARCYRERAVELDGIATSFTVRSQA